MNEPTNTILVGNYRIHRRDERNLQVDEFKSVTAHPGKHVKETRTTEKWVEKGMFGNVSEAARGILRYMEMDSVEVATDLPDLISLHEANVKTIVGAVKEAKLVL